MKGQCPKDTANKSFSFKIENINLLICMKIAYPHSIDLGLDRTFPNKRLHRTNFRCHLLCKNTHKSRHQKICSVSRALYGSVMKWILIASAVGVFVIAYVMYAYVSGGCVSDREFAKSKVIAYLEEKGLPTTSLEVDNERSTDCRVSFVYPNADGLIYFTVIDGGKVTFWDTNKRGSL